MIYIPCYQCLQLDTFLNLRFPFKFYSPSVQIDQMHAMDVMLKRRSGLMTFWLTLFCSHLQYLILVCWVWFQMKILLVFNIKFPKLFRTEWFKWDQNALDLTFLLSFLKPMIFFGVQSFTTANLRLIIKCGTTRLIHISG